MENSKNKLFEKAWDLYSKKYSRMRMQKFLPGVSKLFESGNKDISEQEFNTELRLAYEGLGTPGMAREIAWAASGTLPSQTMEEIYNGKNNLVALNATKTKLVQLKKGAEDFFVANPEAYSGAEEYMNRKNRFMDDGYDSKMASIYAMPTDKFKELNKAIDVKGGYLHAGKDNKVHTVSQDFKTRKTGDIAEDKKTLAKMFGGNLSEVQNEERNLGTLESYARDIGFVDSDALLDYLDQSYDRSKRIEEQKDDGFGTRIAKGILLSNVNAKWNEGFPASSKDIAHDAVNGALALLPQTKFAEALRYAPSVTKFLASGGKVANAAKNVVNDPKVRFFASRAYLPVETGFTESYFRDDGKGIDWADVARQIAAGSAADVAANSALGYLSRNILGSAPKNAYRAGDLWTPKKEIAKDLERRAYEIALENKAANAAHNAIVRNNVDDRLLHPELMYDKLNKNKIFNKSNFLSDDQKDRVFNNAWNTAKYPDAANIPNVSTNLSDALKNIGSYKKTKDFKNALDAAAWEKAGMDGDEILTYLRNPGQKRDFLMNDKKVDAALYSKLKLLYGDYTKPRRGLASIGKYLKYDAVPQLRDFADNELLIHHVYGNFPMKSLNWLGSFLSNNENEK